MEITIEQIRESMTSEDRAALDHAEYVMRIGRLRVAFKMLGIVITSDLEEIDNRSLFNRLVKPSVRLFTGKHLTINRSYYKELEVDVAIVHMSGITYYASIKSNK